MMTRIGCVTRQGQRMVPGTIAVRWRAWRVVTLALAAVALLGLPLVGLASRAAYADGNGTLSIVRPPAGPVGANVVVKVEGAAPSHQYTLGFAPQSGTCMSDFAPFSGVTLTTADDGARTTSFVWPADSSVTQGTSYFVCAQDAANSSTILQSNNAYQVLATAAPSISVAPAQPSASASNDGTPLPTAGINPDGSYSVGQQVTVTGASFVPGGQPIGIWLSGTATNLGTQLTIQPVAGQSNVSDTSGTFTVTVTLPGGRIGQRLYLHAATLDASDHQPPTLVASTPIAIEAVAPTPTPSPAPSPSPTAPLVTPTPSGGSGNGDALRIAGVAGLGGLSALLLIVGVILLASAATTPRDQ